MRDGVRVLVVDDDDDLRELVKLLLESHGTDVVAAADGVEAWERVQRDGAFSLILLDVMMPRMDGPQFLARLRASPYDHIPVVLVSGHLDSLAAAKLLGADAWLTKPLHFDELLATIQRLAR